MGSSVSKDLEGSDRGGVREVIAEKQIVTRSGFDFSVTNRVCTHRFKASRNAFCSYKASVH
jgi:hypothetical protein